MCVSRILRRRMDEELDENCIIQPGRDIPKEQYVRRRAYTKQHKSVWEAAIEKYKHVKCIFQNCHFLALSVEDMISHFGYCNGDGSFAKFTCPYCEGRVTSEKILEIHIRRSHEYEHYGIINNHFLDIGENATGSVQCESKQFLNAENEFRTSEEDMVADVKIERTECDYGDGVVSQGLHAAENDVPHIRESLHYEGVNKYENEFSSGQEMEDEESILSDEQNAEATKQVSNQEKHYKGDHIYFKKMGKIPQESDSNSLLVMKNNNLKHYSGPRNVTDKVSNCKAEGGPIQGEKCVGVGSAVVEHGIDMPEKKRKKSNIECDIQSKFMRQMFKFSFPSVQNTRRKVHQSYTNSWNQSIKTNGFARCLVATCNFISLDIYHIQNHFKTCNGVPAEGPNLCTICNSWLPSAVELSIHSERCKTFRALTVTSQGFDVVNDSEGDILDVNCEEAKQEKQKDPLYLEDFGSDVATVPEPDAFQIGKDNKNCETVSKKEKASALRISDILKFKENGNMDINRIIQPGPTLPKDQYLRRRAYTKQHKAIWETALEKHKYVKCIFQNCHFVAMSLEDMIYHYGYCIGDGSFARFECPHCDGRLTTRMILDLHIKMSHPEMIMDECEDDSGEVDGEFDSNIDDVLPSVEELKKLVNPREIKTYERYSMRSKMAKPKNADVTVKCEPYEWCHSNEGPLSCVTVVLEENHTGLEVSVSDSETITVEPDLISNISDKAIGSAEEIGHERCIAVNEETEPYSDNNKKSELQLIGTCTDSEYETRSEKGGDVPECVVRETDVRDVEMQHKKSMANQDVTCIKDVNCAKNSEAPPGEVEDPGTKGSEDDQERSVREGGNASERKGQSNGDSGRAETRNKVKPEGGDGDSSTRQRSSRRGRYGRSPDHTRREESESNKVETGRQTASKRKAGEKESDRDIKAEANPKMSRVEIIEDEGGTKPPRKRGRPPNKSSTVSGKPVLVDEPIPESIPDIPKKGRRGRKRKNEGTNQVEEVADNSEVKCAKCDFRTMRQRFRDHNFRKHVGLSWIEGETPIDPNNEELISYSIKQAFKVVKSATCEICNSVKKSALGFISHVQNCGKSEEEKEALKITCPYCPSRVLRYSLPVHLKLSHSDSSGDGAKMEEDIDLLSKRKSAIRAANKFQEVLKNSDDEEESMNKSLYVVYEKGMSKLPKVPHKIRALWKKTAKNEKKIPCRRGSCKVESMTVQDARRHHFTCPELPEKCYVCQLCNYYSLTEDDMQQHVNIHPNTDGDFMVGSEEEKIEEEVELNDIDSAADYVRNRSRLPENPIDALEAAYKTKFFVRENLLNGRQTRFCRQSLRMTLNSELEEATDPALPLSELHTNVDDWIGVSLSSVHNHLPCLEESMSFCVTRKHKTNEGIWRKLGRFEGEILEGAPIIFTGGSILSMSWCKISCVRSFKENPSQYLALSSSKEMRKFQDIHEVPGNLSGCIQIWNCGVLKSTPEIPKMMIGIIHDSGQVWDLSWFPTDTYKVVEKDGTTRIGLLGAACQDGTIRIWSICDPQKLKSKFRLPLYRTEPKVILQLEGEEKVGCLRLAIGKRGVVVGGYANGMTAIWNLKTISSPFCKKVDKTFILKPYLSFQAHRTSITALSICPNNDRYIATSGLDRFLRLWDLECVVSPIESTIREVCLDNAWPRHWPVTISTLEDVIPCIGKGMVKAIREAYCDKHRAPLTMDNTCWSLSVNDWLNVICGCNSKGVVKIRYMRNMFMADEKFRLRTGHLFSTTDLRLLSGRESESGSDDGKVSAKQKSKTTTTVPRTYEEGRRYFGLIFSDYTIQDDSKQKSETKNNKKGSQCMEEYPLTSVNKVSWNPNYGTFQFLAVGHQSGFVRIRQLEDSRCEDEVLRFFRDAKDILMKL